MLESRTEISKGALAARMETDHAKVIRMLQGKQLTLENVDAFLAAVGYDWPDLIEIATGKFEPADIRRDMAECVALIAELRRENRDLKAAAGKRSRILSRR